MTVRYFDTIMQGEDIKVKAYVDEIRQPYNFVIYDGNINPYWKDVSIDGGTYPTAFGHLEGIYYSLINA